MAGKALAKVRCRSSAVDSRPSMRAVRTSSLVKRISSSQRKVKQTVSVTTADGGLSAKGCKATILRANAIRTGSVVN